MKINRRGLMLVLSSPSGAGKTTISKLLMENHKNIIMSISATTRSPRPGEVEGKDYFFYSQKKFKKMLDNDEFYEYATVFGNSYGTPKAPVEAALNDGKDVMFDIDWQGTQQLSQKAHEDLVRIFLLPPSIQELENRLIARGQDSKEVVEGRMAQAASEISHWAEYDYVLINDDLQECLEEVQAILAVERKHRSRQTGLTKFVRDLMKTATSEHKS
jgi:guanylate kinase